MRRKLFSVTLADCTCETFTVGGHGGSGKDTSNTGVRIRHKASGAVGEGREERSQLTNKRRAFRRMAETPQFQAWVQQRAAELSGLPALVEQQVEDAMRPNLLRIEQRGPRGWEPYHE